MNKGILDAKVLACYIIKKYSEFDVKRKITNIKLQKSLYFLLAYWGAFVRKGKLSQAEEILDVSDVLYDNRIEAWVYGPVVPDVYYAQKNNELENYEEDMTEYFETVPLLEETINSLLSDIFSISDFKLVSTSHDDKSWSNHFNMSATYHNEQITQEEIIQEYTLRNEI